MKIVLIFLTIISFVSHAETSFQRTVKSMLAHDPEYKRVENLRNYNKFLAVGAGSKLILPEVSLRFSKSNDKSIFYSIEQRSSLSQLRLNYSLFSFGSDLQNFKSKTNQQNAFEQEYLSTLISREYSIISLLLSKIRTLKNIQIQERIIKLKKSTFGISTQRFKTGSLSKNDLTRIKMDFTNTKSTLFNLNTELLNIQSGLEAYGDFDSNTMNFPWIAYFKKNTLKNILRIKKTNNPTVERYKYLSRAYQQDALGQKISHLGRVSINYSRDLYQIEDQQEQYGWASSIVYTLPLFENFNRHTNIQQAKALARTAQTTYRYQKNLIASQIKRKEKHLEISYANLKDRLSLSTESRTLLNNVLSRFKKGVLSVDDLFIEQNIILETDRLTNEAIYHVHLGYLEFVHTLGHTITQSKLFTE